MRNWMSVLPGRDMRSQSRCQHSGGNSGLRRSGIPPMYVSRVPSKLSQSPSSARVLGILPIGFGGVPYRPVPFLVGAAVLDNQAADVAGAAHCHEITHRCAEIMKVDEIPLNPQR